MVVEEVSVKQVAICELCKHMIFNFYTHDAADEWMHLNDGLYDKHCISSPVAIPTPGTVREYERGEAHVMQMAPISEEVGPSTGQEFTKSRQYTEEFKNGS